MLKDYALRLLTPPDIKPAKVDEFQIEKFTITPEQALLFNQDNYLNGDPSRRMEPGDYIRMTQGQKVWMSNTLAERNDHASFILAASGDILITGLGLGMVAAACLRKDTVTSVTVIERQPEVIQLVGPALQELAQQQGKQVRTIRADAMRWEPDRKFDWAWHDIWPMISAEDVVDMQRIQKHYQHAIRCGQECWVEEYVKQIAEEKRFLDNPLGMNMSQEFESSDGSGIAI